MTQDPLHVHDQHQENARDPNQLDDAIAQLMHHRQQIDVDGSMVGVSREALDIVLAAIPLASTGPVGPHNDVTRFVEHPDFRVTHPSLDFDLQVVSAGMAGDVFTCDCTSAKGGYWSFPLADLFPAGPTGDAVREMVRILARAVTEDMVAQLVTTGVLVKPALAMFDRGGLVPVGDGGLHVDGKRVGTVESIGVGGGPMELDRGDAVEVVDPALPGLGQVVHLQAFPEYVMEPGSTHAEAVERMERDLCPTCHLPLGICVCAPLDGQ